MSLRSVGRATAIHYTQALSVELSYRIALVQGLFGVAIGMIGLLLFWLAAAPGPRSASGATYAPAALIAYFLFAGAQGILQESRLAYNLATAIRMGKLSASMLRPYPFLASVVAQAAAHATMRLILLVPLLGTVFFLVDALAPARAEFTAARLGWWLGAVALSLLCGWLTRIVIGLLAFHLTQTWGPELIFLGIYAAASGGGYPPDLLPEGLLRVVEWTPVYYMVGFPSLIATGHVAGAALTDGFARGLVVTALTGVVVAFMWRRGTGRFEAVGI